MKIRDLKAKLYFLYKYYNFFIESVSEKSKIWVKRILKKCKYLFDKIVGKTKDILQSANTWISLHKEKFISKLNNLLGLEPKGTRKDIQEIYKTLSSNEAFLRNRWGRFERLIVWCSKHVFRAVFFLIILLLITSILLATLFIIFIPEQLESILDLLSIIFRAQVTMLGIIFPIIIGFVAILLQGKPYNEPVWDVYRHNSGLMFAIFSFLTLTIFFLFYELFISWWLSHQVSIAVSMSIVCWFIVNLLLSGWVFWKTIQFLSPNRRLRVVTKYIINEIPTYTVWRRDSNKKMLAHQLFLAVLSEVEATLKDNSSLIFEVAKDDLVKFYKEIISSMFLKGYKGEPDNLLLWTARVGSMSLTYMNILIEETRKISKSVVKKIQDDENYYHSWCRFYINLFYPLEINTPEKMAKIYIEGHYYIWEELMEYINSNNLSKAKKDRIIKRYMLVWNGWIVGLAGNIENKKLVDTLSFSCMKEHLNRTSYMLIKAVAYENFEAAEQATNILRKWFDEAFSFVYIKVLNDWLEDNSQRKLLANGITLTLLEDKNVDIYLKTLEDMPEGTYEKRVSTFALQNYCIDIRCVTAAYLMNSTKYHKVEKYKKYINYSNPISSIEDILYVYLRQNDYWRIGNQSSYLNILLEHFKELYYIEKPIWMKYGETPSPIITKFSPSFDRHILPFYQVMGVGSAERPIEQLLEPNLLSKWKRFFISIGIPQENLDKVIPELQKLTSVDDSIIDKVCYQFNIVSKEAEKRRNNFLELIDSICNDWEKEYQKKINY